MTVNTKFLNTLAFGLGTSDNAHQLGNYIEESFKVFGYLVVLIYAKREQLVLDATLPTCRFCIINTHFMGVPLMLIMIIHLNPIDPTLNINNYTKLST